MRKVIRWAFVSVTVLIAMAATAAWMLYQAARQEPEFYQQALLIEPTRQAETGDEFEHEVLELRNDTRVSGEWQAVFTAEQLNGWLAVDLPEKFPTALPAGLEEPRVAIEDGLLRVAARYRDNQVSSVLSFALEIQVADEPNTVAIRIREVRAGALPIPLSGWLEKVREGIQRTNLVVRWSQSDSDPVALVAISSQSWEPPQQTLTLETIAIESGLVRLSGRTSTAPAPNSDPRTDPPAVVQRPLADSSEKNDTTHR
jgi:hypothetical protein